MLKGKLVLLLPVAALVCWQVAGINTVNSGVVDGGNSTVKSGFLPALAMQAGPCDQVTADQAGVVTACPLGDGDVLTNAMGGNCQITLIVRDSACQPVKDVPAEDMWLVGCNEGLLLCGMSDGSKADHATGDGGQYPAGTTTFSFSPKAGGCDTGLYCVVQAIVVGPKCLPIQVRSLDYKSAGAPGPTPCGGDLKCPDGKITNADFAWFVTHYPTGGNPGAPYLACSDYALPLGTISLSDFTKFSIHFAGAGHKCP